MKYDEVGFFQQLVLINYKRLVEEDGYGPKDAMKRAMDLATDAINTYKRYDPPAFVDEDD